MVGPLGVSRLGQRAMRRRKRWIFSGRERPPSGALQDVCEDARVPFHGKLSDGHPSRARLAVCGQAGGGATGIRAMGVPEMRPLPRRG